MTQLTGFIPAPAMTSNIVSKARFLEELHTNDEELLAYGWRDNAFDLTELGLAVTDDEAETDEGHNIVQLKAIRLAWERLNSNSAIDLLSDQTDALLTALDYFGVYGEDGTARIAAIKGNREP